MQTGSGTYLSGVESLRTEFSDLIKNAQDLQQPFYLNSIVSVNADSTAAIIRKSKLNDYMEGRYLSGEYYILDLETNKYIYICDSYPNCFESIPGTRIEGIQWIQKNHVKINAYDSNDEFYVWNAYKEDNCWKISAKKM